MTQYARPDVRNGLSATDGVNPRVIRKLVNGMEEIVGVRISLIDD